MSDQVGNDRMSDQRLYQRLVVLCSHKPAGSATASCWGEELMMGSCPEASIIHASCIAQQQATPPNIHTSPHTHTHLNQGWLRCAAAGPAAPPQTGGPYRAARPLKALGRHPRGAAPGSAGKVRINHWCDAESGKRAASSATDP